MYPSSSQQDLPLYPPSSSMDPYPDMRGSGLSEDDNDPGSSNRTKRGSRACDRCRKIKSKCEPTEGDRCRNCLAAGTPCTYQGPSFKRGPPKGYIHAIEQRWHQVECILGTIMASPRASDIIHDLRQDPYARDVLDRVDTGPYGPTGRAAQPQGTTREGLYDHIMGIPEPSRSSDDRRARRQSRMTREIVSNSEPAMAVPTPEWQDQLFARLSHSQRSTPGFANSPHLSSPASSTSGPRASYPQPARQRLRVDPPQTESYATRGEPHETYRHQYYERNYNQTVDALGHLSVNENKDIRYHDQAAGLHLLANTDRTDDSRTNENGLWKFPRTDSDSHSSSTDSSLQDEPVPLPNVAVQDHLIHLYFVYVHPFFPVIHKKKFLEIYDKHKYSSEQGPDGGSSDPLVYGDSIQGVSKLLLLAMFAFAARYDIYSRETSTRDDVTISKAGNRYAAEARRVLNEVYQNSRPSTCQALLLMGIREFGIGSMEQGWLFIGMACRMAVDLGMNHDADLWKNAQGEPIFSHEDRQARKQIWWSCCIADKLSSVWLGRIVNFREGDFNTVLPELDQVEENEKWEPYPPDALGSDYVPEPGRIMSCFQEQAKLSFIISQIMATIYPVKRRSDAIRRAELDRLESALHHWFFNLPDHLRYGETNRRVTPLPHVLALQIEYQSAVLLLQRAFLPNWNEPSSTEREADPLPMKAFDRCQSAAVQISSMLTMYDQKYGLNRSPPLLSVYLQSAGIMNVVTLNRRPGNTQASVGLLQCINAARAMEETWPCAIQIRRLLEGVRVHIDPVASASVRHGSSGERHKRDVDEAFGQDRNSDVLQREVFGAPVPLRDPMYSHVPQEVDSSTRMMAHSLGIPLPGIQPSTSYYPGYEWWPPSVTGGQQYVNYGQGRYSSQPSPQPLAASVSMNPPHAGHFTFDDTHLSSDFVQGSSHQSHPSYDYGQYPGQHNPSLSRQPQ